MRDNLDLYVNIKFRKLLYNYYPNGSYTYDYSPIETEDCKLGRFGGSNKTFQDLGIYNFECPKDDYEINIFGSIYGSKAEYLEYRLTLCNQEELDLKYPGINKKCKNISETEAVLKDFEVHLPTMT